MKRVVALCVIAISFAACNNNPQNTEETVVQSSVLERNQESNTVEEITEEVVSESAPIISVAQPIHEFGEAKEGEKVKHVYTFVNTGKSPLIISNVSASCGCTTPEYSKHPIAPGEEGNVTVVFDTQNQVGMQQKIITVLSNAEPARTILQLKGEVKK